MVSQSGVVTVVATGSATVTAAGATVQVHTSVKESLGAALTGVPQTWTGSSAASARTESTGFLTTALIAGNVEIAASAGGESGTPSFSAVFRWVTSRPRAARRATRWARPAASC